MIFCAQAIRAHLQHPESAGRLSRSLFGLCLLGKEAEVTRRLRELQTHCARVSVAGLEVDVRLSVGLTRLTPRLEEARRLGEEVLAIARGLAESFCSSTR